MSGATLWIVEFKVTDPWEPPVTRRVGFLGAKPKWLRAEEAESLEVGAVNRRAIGRPRRRPWGKRVLPNVVTT
jgi:hypothetical protein